MSPLILSAPRQRVVYVCDTCRNNLRSLHRARPNQLRTLSSAPWQSRVACSRRQPFKIQVQNRLSHSTTNAQEVVGSGTATLPHRCLLSLSGPDAAKFLQGLITNNVDPTHQSSFYSAFLDARGRVLWDVFIWVWPELVAKTGHWACYIEVDKAEVETLKKHLKRHKLRSKIEIKDVKGEDEDIEGMRVWASWGSEAPLSNNNSIITSLHDPRAPNLHRYLVATDCDKITSATEPLDVNSYHIQRYKSGVPEGPHDILRESALPMECNIDLNQGIDFKKGCYVGQELTIRTKHTGVVRKRILPVTLDGLSSASSTQVPERGADIRALDANGNITKGRPAGKFVAGIGSVGLSLCRLENMTSMKISAEGGTWKPGLEFGIEANGEVIKVKPVLHDWFVLRERELWDKKRTRI